MPFILIQKSVLILVKLVNKNGSQYNGKLNTALSNSNESIVYFNWSSTWPLEIVLIWPAELYLFVYQLMYIIKWFDLLCTIGNVLWTQKPLLGLQLSLKSHSAFSHGNATYCLNQKTEEAFNYFRNGQSIKVSRQFPNYFLLLLFDLFA